MTNENIETALTPISEARRMLAEARTLPELRQLRDYATTARAWAKARGMGIDAENEATEVIVRAERSIGTAIHGLRDQGRYSQGRATPENTVAELNRTLLHSEVGLTSEELAAEVNLDLKRVRDLLTARRGRVWEFGDDKRWHSLGTYAGEEVVTVEGLGLTNHQAADYQRLADIEDERFEAMIAAVRALPGSRLAKANFYSAIDKAERVRSGGAAALPTPTNPGMMAFLSARNHLLGWEVREDGTAGPTKNGLLLLPDDDLRAIAEGLKALALAYTEARSAR